MGRPLGFALGTLPEELLGRDLNCYTDVFNNGTTAGSMGWLSVVVVPEPSTWLIAVVGVLLFFGFMWRTD